LEATYRVIVMGVAGSGKTAVGQVLSEELNAQFLDADSLHPTANIAKMSTGEPLTDADRWPWLARLRFEIRGSRDIVVACSALKRSYRDLLRHAGGVRFVFLDLDAETAHDRAGRRQDHFMGPNMIESQFDALERPGTDEPDVVTVDVRGTLSATVRLALAGLQATRGGPHAMPLVADAGEERDITEAELIGHVTEIVRAQVLDKGARQVLLVPPDHTRRHSRAGSITAMTKRELERHGCIVGVLPALGTHNTMNDADTSLMFGAGVTVDELLVHDWRNGLTKLGEIDSTEVEAVTAGRYTEPVPIEIDAQLFDGWDVVISIGQVVPHEVIGMANFTKNLVIGLGGAATIHRSHFIGAMAGMEQVMGRATSPVRDIIDAAFDRFVDPVVPVLWILTVVEDVDGAMVQRGLFVGAGGTMASGGAAFRAAADLAQRTNLDVVDEPFHRVACWLDPAETRSTWLGNKAIYRTRMAIADDGELIVLAPGVERFGEDPEIDRLIRHHGYRGTPSTLGAVKLDPELATNLAAAAHLIHGSSEGRFRIVYCTDPGAGGLTQAEVESVGYIWRPLGDELEALRVGPSVPSGAMVDRNDNPFYFVANPAMGLWTSAECSPTGLGAWSKGRSSPG